MQLKKNDFLHEIFIPQISETQFYALWIKSTKLAKHGFVCKVQNVQTLKHNFMYYLFN